MTNKRPEAVSRLIDSEAFKNIMRSILSRMIEDPWGDDVGSSQQKSLQDALKLHFPAMIEKLGRGDLARFIKIHLYSDFSRLAKMAPLPSENRGMDIDIARTVDGLAELLKSKYGTARFSFPLGSSEARRNGTERNAGALGRFVVLEPGGDNSRADKARAAGEYETCAQVDVNGFLFDGSETLVSRAAERFSSLVICGWLAKYIQLRPRAAATHRKAWEPIAWLLNSDSEENLKLTMMSSALGDTEAFARRCFAINAVTTFGLARPEGTKVLGVWDPAALTRDLGAKFERLDKADSERLRISFHFFAASMVSNTNAHALLNLTIAFESLLGWDIIRNPSDKDDTRERRARMEARLELIVKGDLKNRRKALSFIGDIYKLRNAISHGKQISLGSEEASRVISEGIGYFRDACLHTLTELAN